MFGYIGKIIRVDLSRGKIYEEKLDESVLLNWLGGRGLGVYYFLKEVNPKVNPLSEENKIFIFTGPLTGISGVPTPGRVTIVSKSPLTNRLSWSNVGGKFGPYLKFSGYDGIIIEGKSEEPVYLEIINGEVNINSAKEIWGKDVVESYNYIYNKVKEKYGVKDVSILNIGPAGENLVKYASIMCERYHGMGRMGFGAIFGYKKLKGIAVYGENKIKVYDENKFKGYLVEKLKKLKNNEVIKELSDVGTLGMLVKRVGSHNAIPSYNFLGYMKIDIEKIINEWRNRIDPKESIKEFCWGCQIGCHKYVRTKIKELYAEGGGPEYWGGFVSLGSSLGIDDIDFIIYAKNLCDKLGLDAISTGHTIACFIELCMDKKIPIDIKFGEKDKIIDLIKKIAYREGIGNDLAEGSYYIANKYGKPESSVSIKNLEIGLCHPEKAIGYRLALATSNRGDHNQTMLRDEILFRKLDPSSYENKAEYVYHMQNLFAITDSLVICIFTVYALDFEDFSELLISVTGMNFTKEKLIEIANRIYTAERYFNVKALGFEKDELPKRFKEDEKFKDLLNKYYELRGWENGIPKEETLKKLGII